MLSTFCFFRVIFYFFFVVLQQLDTPNLVAQQQQIGDGDAVVIIFSRFCRRAAKTVDAAGGRKKQFAAIAFGIRRDEHGVAAAEIEGHPGHLRVVFPEIAANREVKRVGLCEKRAGEAEQGKEEAEHDVTVYCTACKIIPENTGDPRRN